MILTMEWKTYISGMGAFSKEQLVMEHRVSDAFFASGIITSVPHWTVHVAFERTIAAKELEVLLSYRLSSWFANYNAGVVSF